MRFLKYIGAVILICCSFFSSAQKRNYIWCFGDSAGIDFNNINNPVPFFTGMDSRGTCASICDSLGNLLFYVANGPDPLITGNLNAGKVFNIQHQVMSNGDSLKSFEWYNEMVIVPSPDNSVLFYVFSGGLTGIYGFYYSLVDIAQNSGLGAVTQKNIQLQSFAITDCLNAIKHGNGRDWWVIFRKSGVPPGNPNNDFYQYLITPSGIGNVFVQSVGSINATNLGKITFSSAGDRLVFNSYKGMIEIYDYDRCTGIISNPVTIHPEDMTAPIHHFWGCEFSPNGNVLYVTISDQTSYLFQFDLTAPNIAASIDTLWQTSFPGEAIGGLKRGPDGKIYESGPYTNPTVFVYPYPDSMRNVYNENLGVINQPNILGAACDFQPYSFYLGGKRTYWGLPNNPDYDMPALAGSPCDTLTGLTPGPLPKERGAELFLTWVGSWQKLFVNAQGLKGRNVTVEVFDKLGKVISASPPAPLPVERGEVHNGYFTKDIFLPNLSAGVYIVRLKTEKEVLAKKFVKE